ncbi:MAG: hypothetical protein QXK12_08525 [Candidatus Nezhaarchaeales archaeon]
MEEWKDVLVAGIGAALKGTIEGYINRFFPALSGWSGLIAGALLYMYGDRVHKMLKVFGAGVLIAAVGQLFSRFVPTFGVLTVVPLTPEAAARAYAGV